MASKGFFSSDTYSTDKNTRRYFADRAMLGSRWFFIIKFLALVFKSRSIALAGKFDTKEWANTSIDILKLIERCGGRFDINGLSNIKNCQGPAVFIGNHMSILETMVFPGIIASAKEVTFVVKDSLVKNSVFGPVMRARDPIVVNRKDTREDFKTVMIEGQEFLQKGVSVVIFPQSTRRVEFVSKEFNSLGVKLARAANVQVIPFALKTDFWENGKYVRDLGPIKRRRPIHITFGQPFSIKGNGKEENRRIIDFITSHLKEWNAGVNQS